MMNIILRKTDKGREEIATRKYGLSLRTRSILLVIDGRHSGQQLLEKFPGFAISEQLLSSLLEQGFIDYAEDEEQDAEIISGNAVPVPQDASASASSQGGDAAAPTSPALPDAPPRATGAADHGFPGAPPIEHSKTGEAPQDAGDDAQTKEKPSKAAEPKGDQQHVSAPQGITTIVDGSGLQMRGSSASSRVMAAVSNNMRPGREQGDKGLLPAAIAGTPASAAESPASGGSISLVAEPGQLPIHPAHAGPEFTSPGQRISASRPDLDSLVAPDPVLLRVPGGIGSVEENGSLHDENVPSDSWSSGLPSYVESEETLTPLQVIQYFYSRSITEALGDIGQTLRRRAAQATSLEELRALRKPYLLAIAKIRGMETARRLCSELDQLLDMDKPPTPDQLLPGQ